MTSDTLNIDNIKSRMQARGFNQSSLAEQLHIDRSTVTLWFKGKAFPRPAKLLALGRLLSLPFDDLVIKDKVAEPVVAYRSVDNKASQEKHITAVREMANALSTLAGEYRKTHPLTTPLLANVKPACSDEELVEVLSRDIKLLLNATPKIDLQDIIKLYNHLQIVIIPVLWDSSLHHGNAMHAFLPETRTNWVYIDLNTRTNDIKFWLLHELVHVLSMELCNDPERWESLCDAVAELILFPRDTTDKLAEEMADLPDKLRKEKVMAVAEEFGFNPYTIRKSLKRHFPKKNFLGRDFYDYYKKPIKPNLPTVFEQLATTGNDPVAEYIRISKEYFHSSFFELLKSAIHNNRITVRRIAEALSISYLDAQEIYNHLSSKSEKNPS